MSPGESTEAPPNWEFVAAPPRCAPGVGAMAGYRSLSAVPAVHRGLPSATVTFLVSLDDGVETAWTAESLESARPNPVVLGGLRVAPSHVRQRHGQAGVQVAVHPLAARALFGVPSAELGGCHLDGGAVLGRRAVELRERLAEAHRWPEVFALVAGDLVTAHRAGDHARSTEVRPELVHAWHLLERSRGRLPVREVASRVGVSPRHLTTLFRAEVGRSPKTVAMLMRFETATARLASSVRRHGRVDLAGVAVAAGYCDQSHLTHEFVRFAGVPPGAWLSEEFRNLQEGGYVVRAEWDRTTDLRSLASTAARPEGPEVPSPETAAVPHTT